jgi:hypothetical protein
MATLRPIEERDGKGNTIRVNPTLRYIADRQIRKVIGRHDWQMIDNPDFHPPITVQVQNGKYHFFIGLPDSSATRASAREISRQEVEKLAPFIIPELLLHPMKVREARPAVYEVKLAKMDDSGVEAAIEVSELGAGQSSVTISAVEPDLGPETRAAAGA